MTSAPPTAPWRTVEIPLVSEVAHPSPYLGVAVDVVFRGPEGRTLRREAFWDGGRDWRVRFAPTAVGAWSWTASTRGESIAGLDGATGAIECVARDEPEAIYARGFLRRAERHLAYGDGSPFFWLGDTHWRFLWEAWDDSNKDGWASQFRGTVDRRVAQGFTVYQSNLMSFGGDWTNLGLWDRATGIVNPDAFREVVDPRMAYVADAGLVNALGIAWYRAIEEDADVDRFERLARYLVARYGSYPVVWTLAGEVAGYDPELRDFQIASWRRVALAIQDAEAGGYEQLQTAHLTAERPIASYYQGEGWLDFTLSQFGHGDLDMGAGHYDSHLAAFPDVPVIEGESMYEGLTSVESVARRTVDDTMVRQIAYRAIQSGCAGYTYGAQGCWNDAWDYGLGATHWGDLPWYLGVDLPGADQMAHLRSFYEGHAWSTLRPAPDVFHSTSWVNGVLYRPLATADRERRVVVVFFGETYRDGEGIASLVGLTAPAYRVRWFDPRTGEYLLIADEVVPLDGSIAIPDKPDARDWLAVAEGIGA